jgi:hypothetical protein
MFSTNIRLFKMNGNMTFSLCVQKLKVSQCVFYDMN